MQNRWFHLPTLHSPSHGHERKVGWLELFYDLIYVATFIQLGNALSDNLNPSGFLAFACLLVPIWFAWTGFTFFSNRFVVDDFTHRATVFLQMFGIGAMAVFVPQVFRGETAGFALALGSVRLVHVLYYVRTFVQVEQAREMSQRYFIGFGVGMMLWMGSSLAPEPWVYLMWVAAMTVDISTVLGRHSRDLIGKYPPDIMHMSERYGLLTIIVLGESFVKVLSSVSEYGMAQQGLDMSMVLMAGLGLVITCSLWWIYFDDVAGSRLKRGQLRPVIWVYGHLPLTIGIISLGVGIKKAVFFDPLGAPEYRWVLCGTLALALLSVGIIDAVTERRQSELSDRARVNVRIGSAFFILLLAPVGGFMPSWAFVGMIALCCVLQVLFDLSMAPLAADPHAAHEEDFENVFVAPASADEQSGEPSDEEAHKPTKRPTVDDAIRKGTPNELKQDLYVYFMQGSWTRIFVALGSLFLFSNIVFASLYLLESGSVSNVHDDSFIEAFAFSVQTMASIGYGTMTPATQYAHLLVTAQALLSILGIALATGILFAKASQPRAAVLFSEVAVVNHFDGAPMLSFRVGNARGNDLVEASVRVAVARDEITPEGHRLRRLYNLKLQRESSPLFVLSWTVFHRLDEASPLHGIDAENISEKIFSMIVTITGHDSTFAQTIHSRKLYYPEDIRFDHQFVDVISQLDDGRIVLDFEKFHQTEPQDRPETPKGVDDNA